MWRYITEKDRVQFNRLATHPLQSYEWGEFREKTGITVIRKGLYKKNKLVEVFQLTLHKVPKTNYFIGYLPKGTLPTKSLLDELYMVGKEHKCVFIQLEPNIKSDSRFMIQDSRLKQAAHPLFTKYTFQLDLTQSPEDFLKHMSQKTRYNIRVAIKHDVKVREEFSEDAFHAYLHLTEETTQRQGFFAHTKKYHQLMWETLKIQNSKFKIQNTSNQLEAHLFVAYFEKQPLTTWIVFTFHDTLYYPYGASASLHRETMSSNLMMWEVIMYGKKMGLKLFDMWGSMGENPDVKDPWYGFHRFKQGYGPDLVEFVGSYDLVISPVLYAVYIVADKIRWLLLHLRK